MIWYNMIWYIIFISFCLLFYTHLPVQMDTSTVIYIISNLNLANAAYIKNCQKNWETSGNLAYKFQILENDIFMILKVAHA
jgi:hypothetical protein